MPVVCYTSAPQCVSFLTLIFYVLVTILCKYLNIANHLNEILELILFTKDALGCKIDYGYKYSTMYGSTTSSKKYNCALRFT